MRPVLETERLRFRVMEKSGMRRYKTGRFEGVDCVFHEAVL